MKETTKRYLKTSAIIIFALLTFSICLIKIGTPFLVKKILLPKIESSANVKIGCEIRKISFFSAEINDLLITKNGNKILEIDNLKASYYLLGLLGLKELKISGFRLHIDNIQKSILRTKIPSEKDSFSLPPARMAKQYITIFKQKLGEVSHYFKTSGAKKFLSKSRLKIDGGQVYILMTNQERQMIPFNANIKIGTANELIKWKIDCEPFSGEFELSGSFNASSEIQIATKGNRLKFPYIVKGISGYLDFASKAFASPTNISSSLTCDLSEFTYSTDHIKISSTTDENIKLLFNFNESEGNFSAENISIKFPLETNLSFETGKIFISENSIEASGYLIIKIPENSTYAKMFYLGQFIINIPIRAIWDEKGIKITLCNERSDEKFIAKFANAEFSTKVNELTAEFLYQDALQGTTKLKLSDNTLTFVDSKLEIPLIQVEYNLKDQKFTVFANFANGTYTKNTMLVSNISASAILNSLNRMEENQLTINCGKIILAGKDYGTLQLSGHFDFEKAFLNGNYDLGHNSGFNVPINISYRKDGNTICIKATHGEEYIPVKFENMGVLSEALAGYSFEGNIKIDYLYESKFGLFSGKFSKDVKDGLLVSSDRGLRIEGINGYFRSDDPFVRKSLPQQKFFAKRLLFGKSELTDIMLVYALEDKTTFFIENLSAGWCDGKLYISSARFDSSPQKKFTVLFDRILLSKLLSEFGVGEAAGEGRVNGRVPICYNAGKIDFQDAFFYSTPGLGGNIKLKKAGSFLDSIPRDGEQFSNIDLTLEALKDFDYDWSKISLQSEGDQLLAKFEFLGKPRTPLPFRYNPEKGIFKRVDIDTAGTIFQGIKLDLNCRLPLNEILRYITIFKNFLIEKGVPL